MSIINPNERYDLIAGDTPEGNRLRTQTTLRSEAYDNQPNAPQLGGCEKDELEWVQYALPERNDDAIGTCPFRVCSA